MINKKIMLILTIVTVLFGSSNAISAIGTPYKFGTNSEAEIRSQLDLNTYMNISGSITTGASKSETKILFPSIMIPPVSTPPLSFCACSNIAPNTANMSVCTADAAVSITDMIAAGAACEALKTVGSFRMGSNSDTLINATVSSIELSGEILESSFKSNGNDIAKKIAEVSTDITESLVLFQNSMNQSKTERSEKMNDIKMNYMTELKEREIRAKNSEFSIDDTAEEIAFLEYQMEQELSSGNDKPQILISKLKSKYDDNNFVLPIKIRSSDRLTPTSTGDKCEDYDPSQASEQIGCFYYQKSQPGKKLEMIFNECSRAKKQTLMAMNQKSSNRVVSNTLKAEQTKSVGSVVTTKTIVSDQISQRVTSCNDKEYGFGLCSTDLSPSEYIEKVVYNEIIPNGNVSATNMFTPPVIGSYDGETDLNGDELISSLISSLEKDNTAVSENTPSLIHTYKTSSQYYASKDYIVNLLNRNVISNQSVNQRQNISSSKFQSKFNQREAALSLAEQVMNSAIKNRIGSDLRDELNSGNLTRDTIVRESLSGAGYLDILEDMVNKDYTKLVVSASSGQPTTEALSRMSPKNIKNWQYTSQVLNTKLKLESQFDDEEIELLLSTYLSLGVNSPSNIEFLEKMKVK